MPEVAPTPAAAALEVTPAITVDRARAEEQPAEDSDVHTIAGHPGVRPLQATLPQGKGRGFNFRIQTLRLNAAWEDEVHPRKLSMRKAPAHVEWAREKEGAGIAIRLKMKMQQESQ